MTFSRPPDDHDKPLPDMMQDWFVRDRMNRRAALRRLGSAGLLLSPSAWSSVGCGDAIEPETLIGAGSGTVSSCTVIPSETAGPYPGDGTNGPNVLVASGIVRADIRSSFGSAGTTVAPGAPLTITLQLVNTSSSCAALSGFAIYLWHCNATGGYSLYSTGVTTQNYLRGVQMTDGTGRVSFTTIFPGCYSGRWPHAHFEIYRSLSLATTGSAALKTSQLALPEAVCREVYGSATYGSVYTGSTSNLNGVTLASDNVFSDTRAATQLATVSGNASSGYGATLVVGVAA